MTLTERRKRFTESDCEFLERGGLLSGNYELIDGDILTPMPQKNRHRITVIRLLAYLMRLFPAERVGTQATVRIDGSNLPEPDAFVLSRDLPSDQSYPAPGDVLFIAEVSDTTLADDLTVKARLYGAAGIPEYWVLDIEGRTIIVHRQPGESGYGEVQALAESADAALAVQPEASTRVSLLMPPLPGEGN